MTISTRVTATYHEQVTIRWIGPCKETYLLIQPLYLQTLTIRHITAVNIVYAFLLFFEIGLKNFSGDGSHVEAFVQESPVSVQGGVSSGEDGSDRFICFKF